MCMGKTCGTPATVIGGYIHIYHSEEMCMCKPSGATVIWDSLRSTSLQKFVFRHQNAYHCTFKNSDGSGETARMRRLARACAARLPNKYPLLMKWLIVPGFVMSCNSDISVFEEKSKENIRKVKIAPTSLSRNKTCAT